MPQLDSLRAFAVCGVLIHHFMNVEALPWKIVKLPWGHLGVRLFFVLSGFLITRILLDCRHSAEISGNRWFYVKQFYLRRFLRIFPLYYLVIGAGFILNIPPVREVFVWLVTYTTNFYVAVQGHWLPQVGHLWTLAVEEQFYIVWPWVVLFAPRKFLVPVMAAAVAMGPLYRLTAVIFKFNDVAAHAMTFSCLDTLGIGALLALMVVDRPVKTYRYLSRLIMPGALAAAVILHLNYNRYPKVSAVLLDTCLGLVFAWLILAASRGFSGVIGRVLEWKPLVYCGRISYGIYVYHFFMALVVPPLLAHYSLSVLQWQLLNFSISGTLTLVIAAVSWHFFEKPINDLKRRFAYRPAEKAPDPQPTLVTS